MNEYQLGKDVGEILARLKALEENAARCHCCHCCHGKASRGSQQPASMSGHGTGTKADPIQCLPYTPQTNDQFCVYRVIDSEIPPDGTPALHSQETVCIVCTQEDAACETNNFWIVTLRGKYELTPKDLPGSDFCRSCPEGGRTFQKFKGSDTPA